MARADNYSRLHGEERDRVLYRRLSAHNLARRLPSGSMLQAAGACGIQNTPRSSAELSILSRVEELRAGEVDRALEERALVQAWSQRAAPHVFPVSDYHTFTSGLLPTDERSLRHFIMGATKHLDRAGMTATRLLEIIAPVIAEVLDGRGMVKDDLGRAVAESLGPYLSEAQIAMWNEADCFGRFGETLVRFGLYAASLRGAVCHGPAKGASFLLVRPDQWLGPLNALSAEAARAEVVRRYLHCYGPSTAEGMAKWAGISKEQSVRQWSLVSQEIVDLGRGRGWLLASDLSELERPSGPEGTRLLPPHDPYLQARDRDLMVPDFKLHKCIWRAAGSPGAVLHRGELVGTWRQKKRGSAIAIDVVEFSPLGPEARSEIKEEGGIIAEIRGGKKLSVAFQRV